jgi:hypothetical protein
VGGRLSASAPAYGADGNTRILFDASKGACTNARPLIGKEREREQEEGCVICVSAKFRSREKGSRG